MLSSNFGCTVADYLRPKMYATVILKFLFKKNCRLVTEKNT